MDRLLPFQSVSRPDPQNGSQIVGITEQEARSVIEALASQTRREILAEVYREPGTASEIAERTNTSLQNAKYHLDKLQDTDLIEVPETWYSAQGKEMNVYTPTNESIVIIAGNENTTSTLRDRLRQFIGGIGVLLGGSIVVEYVARSTAQPEPVFHRQSEDPTTIIGSLLGLWISPGLLFFIGGLFVLLLSFIWTMWSHRR